MWCERDNMTIHFLCDKTAQLKRKTKMLRLFIYSVYFKPGYFKMIYFITKPPDLLLEIRHSLYFVLDVF